jgi:endoglucanase
VVELKDMWIDIGAKDEEDAASAVQIGDAVTVQLGTLEMRNGLINGPAMDNRTGVWVVIEALRRAAAKGIKCSLYAASTVQEEIGLRGAKTAAYGIDPHVGIAVDVTHATDCPTIDKRQRGKVDLGKGPVIARGANMNPRVGKRLTSVATAHEIPFQVAALGGSAPNNVNALQVTRAGVATGLVQIPNRYMHSAVETIALSDLDHAADLLAEFACDLTTDATFIP